MKPDRPVAERVTLSNKEASTDLGLRLIANCEAWLADGEITLAEFSELQVFLTECGDQDAAAFTFLREEVTRYIEDGEVHPWELDRIRKALLRVIPKEEREKATAVYRERSNAKYHEQAAERDAFYAERAKHWARTRDRKKDTWSCEPATEAQLDYLRDLGAAPSAGLSKYEASLLIDDILNRDEPALSHPDQATIDAELKSIDIPDYLKPRIRVDSQPIIIQRQSFWQRIMSIFG